ncbi:hypothetical protein ACFYXC_20990 [Streptomyces sp. NPDC002701]|uniref:hypothetical protein n=1 Tax=unclassified Streptomyces TaxID=2593676 RepID=UPI0036C83ECE
MRTTLAAGVFAVTAVLGGAGSALADDHDENRHEGGFRVCAESASAGDGEANYGASCAEAHWKGYFQGDRSSY